MKTPKEKLEEAHRIRMEQIDNLSNEHYKDSILNSQGLQKCNSCKKVRSITDYKWYDNTKQIRRRKVCHECNISKNKNRERKESSRKHYQNNKEYYQEWQTIHGDKEYAREKSKKYYQDNKEERRDYHKKYYQDSKDYYKKWREDNKDYFKKYRKDNKEKIRARHNNKMKTDSLYKMAHNLRSRVSSIFKRKSWTKDGTQKLLGCTWEIAHKHLERQFTEGMNWDNHGEWHIDHIIPLSSAKTEEELKSLCHYTNLQPLWAYDNISKGNKTVEHQIKLRI